MPIPPMVRQPTRLAFCVSPSSFAAAYPAAVNPFKVLSPRCAHSSILPAMSRRMRCLSLPAGRIKHARSSAISILDKVRGSKLSLIIAISWLPALGNLARDPNSCLLGSGRKKGAMLFTPERISRPPSRKARLAGRAIATSPDLPPVPGTYATFSRDHEYKRHGTLSLLAGIDLLTGKVHALVKDRHRS